MPLQNKFYNLMSYLVLLLGLASSVVVSYEFKRDSESSDYQQFAAQCQEIQLRIMARLKAHEQTLLGGAALFDASKEVERVEWYAYAKRVRVSEHFHGIQGLGFSQWLQPAQLDAHIAKIRAEGFADYQVRPEGKREAYTSIVYLEPFSGRNLRAFGYDMYSEPVRRKAMERARDEKCVSLSGRVTLVQETSQNVQAGTLMYVAIYQKNKATDTTQQRKDALLGWVYSPFRMNDLLNNIVSNEIDINNSQIHLRVYDGNNTLVDNLLYDSNPSFLSQKPLAPISIINDFNGTHWNLVFEKNPEIITWYTNKVWISLITGLFITGLLFLLVRVYLNTRKNAVTIALQLTAQLQESEKRFRVLADSAPVLIWIAGLDKLCYQFNKTWLDFTGRTHEQEYGNGWAEGVHAEDLQRCLDTYIAAFEKREAFKMEYRLRRYDGQYRWLLDNGIPRFSDEGVFLGYIGSCIDIDERKQIEAALKASERKFRSIIEISPVPMVLNDGHDNIIFINPAFTKTFGYYLNEIPTLNVWRNKAYPDKQYREQIAALWQKQLQETEKTHNTFKPTELIIRTKSGVDKTVLASATAFESFDSLHLVVLYDISEHKQIEAELRIAATVFEAQEGMLITNAQNIILKVNHAFSAITGYSADDVIGQTPRLLRSGRQNKNFYTALWDTINNTGSWKGEIWEKRKNGQIYPAWLTITAVKDTASNTVTHYVATLTDITARKATEEYINRLAFYDALTQLPNRRLLQERLKYGIELSQRTGNQMAVLMLDLDRFKAVNDTLGHAAGDELLIQVAERIKACLRKVDLVARLGGDEFVILMDEIKHYKNVDRIAGLIIHKLNLPFTLSQNHVVNIGVSIGISLYPQHGNSPEILMDNADTALYRAKEQGRGCFVYFDFVVGAT